MSWSFSCNSTVEAFPEALGAARGAANIPDDPWTEDQIHVAMNAAKALVASGSVGSTIVVASLSGHANPEHKPRQGYSHDGISVSVSCSEPYPQRSGTYPA